MKILCIGGGPAGLYFGVLMKQLDRSHEVTILERNRPDDTFGFGVVFSDRTLAYLQNQDQETYRQIMHNCQLWDPIEVRFQGKTLRCGGNGFSAISRKRLLNILQGRASDLGVDLHFQTEFNDLSLLRNYELVIAADGVNSLIRRTFAEPFRPTLALSKAKFIWFGTTKHYDSLTFIFEENEHGIFGVHGYPYDEHTSTFIVETDEGSWRKAGLDRFVESTLASGKSDFASMAYCQKLFAKHLDGHELLANNSKWLNFPRVRNETWHHGNIVLMGDAAHTAHFSVGSGTKMAMEDAIALSQALSEQQDIPTALDAYERVRRPEVERIQRAARPSLAWWESFRHYKHLAPEQFVFNFLTRNPSVTYSKLQVRDPRFVTHVHDWFTGNEKIEPLSIPLQLRGVTLANRIAIALSHTNGDITDPGPVQLGDQVVGEAGLVMLEFGQAVGALSEARFNPFAPAGWGEAAAHPHGAQQSETHLVERLRRSIAFIHSNSPAKVGLQHPSIYSQKTSNELDRTAMQRIRDNCLRWAQLAAEAGCDLLELDYGQDSLIEVLDTARNVWPRDKPIAVRISTPEHIEAVLDSDEAIEMVRLLKQHGCDLIGIAIGEAATKDGRLCQRLLSERIRNEVPIPTMMVGGLLNVDEINTNILAARVDLYLAHAQI